MIEKDYCLWMILMRMKVSARQLPVVDRVQCFVFSAQASNHEVGGTLVWMKMKMMMLDKEKFVVAHFQMCTMVRITLIQENH